VLDIAGAWLWSIVYSFYGLSLRYTHFQVQIWWWKGNKRRCEESIGGAVWWWRRGIVFVSTMSNIWFYNSYSVYDLPAKFWQLPQTNPGFNNTPFKFTKYSNAYMLVYIRDSDKDKIICNVDEKDIAEHLRVSFCCCSSLRLTVN